MINYLRPDEEATYSEIERAQARDRGIKKGIKTAASTALAVGGIGAASSKLIPRVLPFLSEFIPVDLALKGISKISPQLGDFLKKGQSMGLDIKEGLNFVKDNLSPPLQNENTQKRNIIQQYSPELFNLIQQEIQKGRSALQAAGIAKISGKFDSIIKKMEKDHKMPYSSIVESTFGQENQAQPQADNVQAQQLAPGPQQGIGNAELMAAFQKIMQM